MLYLEDFLEMIENLPMEMRDRFTEMRETELQVQNAMDSLDDKVKIFFKKCGSTPPKQELKDDHFDKIKQEYAKALEDADEKVQLANQIYDLVERHLRKLDQELAKFKMELEADNAGITEILEKRSLEMDNPPPVNNHRAEKRKYSSTLSSSNHVEKKTSTERVLSSLAHEAARETLQGHRASSAASSPATNMFDSTPASRQTPAISYSLGHVGAGSNAAIAAAASRAIGATLEHLGISKEAHMQQGRRTASLKASYEAVMTKNADLSKELQLGGRELVSGGSTTPAETAPTPKSSARKSKAQKQQQQQQQQSGAAASSQPTTPLPTGPPPVPETVAPGESLVPMDIEETTTTTNWQYDPNEPRYCICNDVSYGDMVGCDNDDCPIEWFHYACVGLAQAPKGKWYCPQCQAAMKRRGRK